MSSHSNPQVDPNIWFVADMARGPEWVVVRAARFPERRAERPANLDAIARNVAHMSRRGHFAPSASHRLMIRKGRCGAGMVLRLHSTGSSQLTCKLSRRAIP